MKKISIYSPMWPTSASPGFGSFVAAFCRQISSHPKLETSVFHSTTDLNSPKFDRLKDIFVSTFKFLSSGLSKDIWYIHYLPLTMPLIVALARLSGKTVVVNLHGDELTDGGAKRKFLRHSTRWLLRNYSRLHFVVPSAYFKELTIRWFSLRTPASVFVSPSGGIPDSWYQHRAGSINPSNTARPLTVGYVGRLDPGKNWEMAFTVCQALNQQGIQSKVLICGWGPDESKLPTMGKETNVPWEVVPGVPRNELPSIYKKIDMLVFWSTRPGESLGLVGLEALASGIPVIGYPDYGPATYIEHKKNGYLLPAATREDLNQLADWVREYTLRADEISVFCTNSSQKYRESMVADLLVKHLLSLPANA